LTALVSPERFGALLRKEKDGASRPNHFWADSLNAFIPRFAELKAFLFSPSPSSPSSLFRRDEKEDEDEDGDEFFSALVFQQKNCPR